MPKFRYFRKPALFDQAEADFAKICKELQWRQDLVLNGGRFPKLVFIRREIAQKMHFEMGYVPLEIAWAFKVDRSTTYQLLEMNKGQKNYDYRPKRA